jgi:hypothetical protein
MPSYTVKVSVVVSIEAIHASASQLADASRAGMS